MITFSTQFTYKKLENIQESDSHYLIKEILNKNMLEILNFVYKKNKLLKLPDFSKERNRFHSYRIKSDRTIMRKNWSISYNISYILYISVKKGKMCKKNLTRKKYMFPLVCNHELITLIMKNINP